MLEFTCHGSFVIDFMMSVFYLHRKFEKIEDGITLFDNDMSPCARRVRMVLIEKGLQWHKVMYCDAT